MAKHEHYKRDVSQLKMIDFYRIAELYGVTCPVAQHVLKKAIAVGQRGHKDLARDWQDILDSAERRLEMLAEDDDWIEWDGGECPLLKDARVRVKTRAGMEIEGFVGAANWNHYNHGSDIIAYRVIKP